MSGDGDWHAWKEAGRAGHRQGWVGVRSMASGAGPPGLSPRAITAGYVTWSRLFSPSVPPFLVCKVGRVLMTQPRAVLGTERSKTAAWRVPQLRFWHLLAGFAPVSIDQEGWAVLRKHR